MCVSCCNVTLLEISLDVISRGQPFFTLNFRIFFILSGFLITSLAIDYTSAFVKELVSYSSLGLDDVGPLFNYIVKKLISLRLKKLISSFIVPRNELPEDGISCSLMIMCE